MVMRKEKTKMKTENKKFYSVELNARDAELLTTFLKERNYYYELSDADNLKHFEIYLTDNGVLTVNAFLNTL